MYRWLSFTAATGHRLVPGRLFDQHRLEAPFQGGIFFDVLAELVDGRRAHTVQFAPGQSRFEDIRSVHRSTRGPGADQGVHLVDEQQHLALLLGDFLDDIFQPVLELATVLGAGDQGAHIQGEQTLALKALGHVAFYQTPGQTFGHGRLAHPGQTDENGIVLGAAAEDLHHAADFLITTDDGVDLARTRGRAKVAGVLVQRGILPFTQTGLVLTVVGGVGAAHFKSLFHFGGVHVEGFQYTSRPARVFGQGQQQFTCTDHAAAALLTCFQEQLLQILAGSGKFLLLDRRQAPQLPFHSLGDQGRIKFQAPQGIGGQAGFAQQRPQQVQGLQLGVSHFVGLGLSLLQAFHGVDGPVLHDFLLYFLNWMGPSGGPWPSCSVFQRRVCIWCATADKSTQGVI